MKPLTDLEVEVTQWDSLSQDWQQRLQQSINAQRSPQGIVYPSRLDELAATMQTAAANGWTILPCGQGTKLNWGGIVQSVDVVVSTQYLNRLIEHAAGDLTVTVEAGMKLSELQQILAQANQFLPLDPNYPDTATIGGVIATADTGSWRHRYGSVRDFVLGITFVRADGAMAKAGGRVVKNVAGYDLMKLFTGSYGTLGILGQVTLRVYPQPEASQTLILTGDLEGIKRATQTLLTSTLTPTAVDLLAPKVVQRLGMGNGLGLVVRFQSVQPSVSQQGKMLSAIATKLGLQIKQLKDSSEWDYWRDAQQLFHRADSGDTVCKLGILPSQAVEFLGSWDDLAIIHAGSGLGRLQSQDVEKVSQARQYCQKHQGFLTLLEAPQEVKQRLEPWGYTGNALNVIQSLKQKFDPQALLSPGRFVGEI
jgi:glycolate oxidase FAD binding subunit